MELENKSPKELYEQKLPLEVENFGIANAKVIFAILTFSFKEIIGDVLGDLYQKYFDAEVRKALGEFYTPLEVVEYILDNIGYIHNITNKRLLDPSCGSGTFLVESLKRYIADVEPYANKNGWAYTLDELCNKPKIIGFDINPFACLIAQIRFMIELIPYYKKAITEETIKPFTLKRLPIFRTDSLIDERKISNQQSLSIIAKNGKLVIKLPIPSPTLSEEFIIKIEMPLWETVRANTDILNYDEYFSALQAIFDVVKKSARLELYELHKEDLKNSLKEYLGTFDDIALINLVDFFFDYAKEILKTLKDLKYKFGDGRLIKSIEDVIIASILKNYITYDFVVGNPPYVRIERLSENQREYYRKIYVSASGRFDLYSLFIERGMDWLKEDGKIGVITSNKFIKRGYGKALRKLILQECKIEQYVDLTPAKIFMDATNDPCILVMKKGLKGGSHLKFVKVKKEKDNLLDHIKQHITDKEYSDEYIDLFEGNQSLLDANPWKIVSTSENTLLNKIKENANYLLEDVCENISEGITPSRNDIFIISEDKKRVHNFESE
ncbi:MAG: class I SAM-dependent DNA methyltransferase, partial [Methanosarcinales archaeon]